MAKSLIIVESPAKTKTIKNFLGTGRQESAPGDGSQSRHHDFVIVASMGHVRDLPEREMGVDIEHDFAPKYVPIPARKDVLKRLASEAKGATHVYLASDPDREGEAIAWHLAQALNLKDP